MVPTVEVGNVAFQDALSDVEVDTGIGSLLCNKGTDGKSNENCKEQCPDKAKHVLGIMWSEISSYFCLSVHLGR